MNSSSPVRASGQLSPTTKQTQVAAYINDLYTAIEHFEKALEVHRVKLDPVLAPVQPPPKGELGCAPQEMICPVADRIRSATSRLHNLVTELSNLTDRTEA